MLYKYVTFKRSLDILQYRLIRLSQPSDFNDPFELHPSFDLMSKADIAALPDAPNADGSPSNMKFLTNEALAKMFVPIALGLQRTIADTVKDDGAYSLDNNKIARSTFDAKYGILSLSETHHNLLMWAHYADHHRGCVIQFDESHEFFKGNELVPGQPRLGKVEYVDRRPVLSPSTLDSPQIFFRKSPVWAYEKEWRLIRPLEEATRTIEQKPHPVCLFDVPPEAITGIVTGAQMRPDEYQQLIEYWSNQPDLRHVKVFHMMLSREEYALTTTPPIDGLIDQASINGKVCVARDFSV